ncbi:MAG: hypothetical protein Q8N99_01150 [Nanoarchaeota archaeon]|nr:hypothetical protein [Nanoarchaeota archaeon]
MTEISPYIHDLGQGQKLYAYSLDPKIGQDSLTKLVCSLDGKNIEDFEELSRTIVNTDRLTNISELELIVREGNYSVPEVLKLYKEAIGKKWDSEGKFNGPVIIATDEITTPMNVIQGGYYDYAATRLDGKPWELLPEIYREGETIEEILLKNQLSLDFRARYFGLGHLLFASNGCEFLLIQRAKGVGIAENCIATPGSTPDLVLKNLEYGGSNFDLGHYWSHHLAEEMKEEFKLKWGEFNIGEVYLYDDRKLCPFGVIKITTKLSVKELVQRMHGDLGILKEHTILYKMNIDTIPVFLDKFPVFRGIRIAIPDMINK